MSKTRSTPETITMATISGLQTGVFSFRFSLTPIPNAATLQNKVK